MFLVHEYTNHVSFDSLMLEPKIRLFTKRSQAEAYLNLRTKILEADGKAGRNTLSFSAEDSDDTHRVFLNRYSPETRFHAGEYIICMEEIFPENEDEPDANAHTYKVSYRTYGLYTVVVDAKDKEDALWMADHFWLNANWGDLENEDSELLSIEEVKPEAEWKQSK